MGIECLPAEGQVPGTIHERPESGKANRGGTRTAASARTRPIGGEAGQDFGLPPGALGAPKSLWRLFILATRSWNELVWMILLNCVR